MSEEMINEIIKSHVYGVTVAEMSVIYGVSEKEIADIIADNLIAVADMRDYRKLIEG